MIVLQYTVLGVLQYSLKKWNWKNQIYVSMYNIYVAVCKTWTWLSYSNANFWSYIISMDTTHPLVRCGYVLFPVMGALIFVFLSLKQTAAHNIHCKFVMVVLEGLIFFVSFFKNMNFLLRWLAVVIQSVFLMCFDQISEIVNEIIQIWNNWQNRDERLNRFRNIHKATAAYLK